MSRASVCVVGSVNMDLVVRTPHLPRAGETVPGGPFDSFPGGKGANQAVAAARMGANASMIACVGPDAYGSHLLALLDEEGVDTSGVTTQSGTPTGVALITVDDRAGENTIVVAGGANLMLTNDHVGNARSLIKSADVLLMQLEIPVEAAAHAASIARAAGTSVLLNAAPATALPDSLLAGIDCLVVNRTEAAALAGVAVDCNPAESAASLATLGPSSVIVTLGEDGSFVQSGTDAYHISAAPIRPLDTVGAGDAFCGVLAAALAQGHKMPDACKLASAAGALATTKAGAIPSLPRADEVNDLAARMR